MLQLTLSEIDLLIHFGAYLRKVGMTRARSLKRKDSSRLGTSGKEKLCMRYTKPFKYEQLACLMQKLLKQ